MTNLPAELVPLILSDCTTSATLALVNKYYNDIVTPLLYREVILEGTRPLKAFSETMVTGRSILSKYPTLLSITYWPLIFHKSDPDCGLIPTIVRQLLMHVPNLTNLHLNSRVELTYHLLKDPQYPFKLHRLDMRPINDAVFLQFLKAQLEIEEIILWYPEKYPHWAQSQGVIPTPLQPDILPKLRSIKSDEYSVSVMVPNHPVTKLELCMPCHGVWFHKCVAQSLAPVEYLEECIDMVEYPWESGIVSQCFSSLEFCWSSLAHYSLKILFDEYELPENSLLLFLKGNDNPSHGFDALRRGLSKFSALRKFYLNAYSLDWHDLTPEFCETVPELSRFDVWQESCPNLVEVTLFGITLEKA